MRKWRRGKFWLGERTASSVLAAYRGLSLVVAVTVIFSLGYVRALPYPEWLLITGVAVYTLYKIIRPTPSYARRLANYIEFGIDVVLDMVAGPYMQKNIDLLARDGRYVIIAFLQGPKAELNMRYLFRIPATALVRPILKLSQIMHKVASTSSVYLRAGPKNRLSHGRSGNHEFETD